MSTIGERLDGNVTEIVSMVVLGAGFLALFTGWSPIPFFLIWIIGFAVVLPIVAILTGEEEDEDEWSSRDVFESTIGRLEATFDGDRHDESEGDVTDRAPTTDALATIRDRYARGDLTDEQFKRKLDRLLETDTPEGAAEWRERAREATVEPETT